MLRLFKNNKAKKEKKNLIPRYITFLILSIILGGIFTALTSYAATMAASNISYSNTNSGLTATNAQNAIDEIYSGIFVSDWNSLLNKTIYSTTAIGSVINVDSSSVTVEFPNEDLEDLEFESTKSQCLDNLQNMMWCYNGLNDFGLTRSNCKENGQIPFGWSWVGSILDRNKASWKTDFACTGKGTYKNDVILAEWRVTEYTPEDEEDIGICKQYGGYHQLCNLTYEKSDIDILKYKGKYIAYMKQ